MLSLRILTALLGIPVIIASVYFGGPWYALLLLLVVNLGIYEYNNIVRIGDLSFPALVSYFGVSMFIVVLYFDQHFLVLPLIILLFFVLFVSALLNMERLSISESALSMWGIIYLGGLCGYMLMLRMLPDGALYTYLLFVGIWIHDTLAYFIGVKWGMRKFAPQISPKKSVEGSLAGLGGVVVIFFSVSILVPGSITVSPVEAVILGLGISVFGQLGDLIESALKRQMQVKDSGGLIPGHGGVLDRFDSLMLAAPFVYYFFVFMNMS